MGVLHLVSSNQDSPRGAVVFVHGLCGHPFKSWQADDYSTFWPLWLAADLPEIAVYTLEYEAGASNWFGESMQLPDRATDVLAELASRDLDRLPIVFVCHSLGGLVAKQVLRPISAPPLAPVFSATRAVSRFWARRITASGWRGGRFMGRSSCWRWKQQRWCHTLAAAAP